MSGLSTSSGGYNDLAREIRELRYERIVFVNGCFDVLHPGHMSTLAHARSIAGPHGAVVVGLNDDDSVRRIKGPTRPIFDVEDRATMLMHLRHVDHVITFSEDTPLLLIQTLRPDVIVKGADYLASQVVGHELCMVSIAPFDDRWSTTDVVRRIKDA